MNSCADRCYISLKALTTNSHVSEEQPARDQRLLGGTWGLAHDVKIRGVEAQSSSRQTVSHQVDPQQLDGDQSLGQTQGSSQEDTKGLEKKKKKENGKRSKRELERKQKGGVDIRATHQTTSPTLEEMR